MSVSERGKLLQRLRSEDGSFLGTGRGSFVKIDSLRESASPNEEDGGGGAEEVKETDYDGILGVQAEESHIISSNVETSILELQEVLKYTPFKTNLEKNPKFELEPLFEGEVRVQKSTLTDVEWRTYWMVVVDSILYLKYDRRDRNVFADRICYVAPDELSAENIPDQAVAELYMGFLEKQKARFAFRVYTPRKILLIVVDSADKRDHILRVISGHLKSVFSSELWQEKEKAAKELEPLTKDQFVIDIEKQETVLKALAQSGIVGEDAILASPNKDKSGVLKMYQNNELMDKDEKETLKVVNDWVEYYFVLLEDVLYYFLHSKATLPTGFVSLKYAAVDIDRGSILRNEFVFTITTPIRTLTLMTKHSVALATWISAIETAVLRAGQQRGSVAVSEIRSTRGIKRRDSNDILAEIEKLRSPIESLTMFLKNHSGIEVFREFLRRSHSDNELECLKEIKALAAVDLGNKDAAVKHARMLYDRFVSETSPEAIRDLDPNIREELLKHLEEPTMNSFRDLWADVVERLKVHFESFKNHEDCAKFVSSYKGSLHPDERKIEPFDLGEKGLGFQMDLKSKSSRVRIVRFDMTKSILTIGRDVANDLVVDDEKVSRSHARIEYSRRHAKYLDLGSAHGSKLNGQKFTTANLQMGDTIRMGTTTLKLIAVDQKMFKKVMEELGTFFGKK
eukprot:TRINITY_DN6391_c1_g2_i1.p1 TRINITY_DN6391_c1_g2~~TRINITY_DN6391_c1_g2_i1.p1  ORF type:complete len:682 (+),score=168.21 TRINITY_DN6391_c1_g2_i1:45-2090(+)